MPVALKYLIAVLFFVSMTFASPAQDGMNNFELKLPADNSLKTIYHLLGSSKLSIKLTQYGTKENLAFINLHDDEFTSVEATKKILEQEGGLLIEIENKGKRDLKFKIGNTFYTVDPNRIFSREGITASLKEKGRYSSVALASCNV